MSVPIEMNSITTDHATPEIAWKAAIQRLKFQKRVCSTFIAKEVDKTRCVCNYKDHNGERQASEEVWNWKKHTTLNSNEFFGLLPESKKPYLRCDIKADLKDICLVLFGVWNLPIPRLIMRMLGDADSVPSIKLENELIQGISDAANASGAWIITSGYKEESLTELVGEVVYKNQIKNSAINFNAIAVGKWGNIHQCHKLKDSIHPPDERREGSGRYNLELHHTHYLFFDDGTCDSMDTGEFTSKLAGEISHGARRKIPLVTILVGGTLHALKLIFDDLENGVPVVLIEESGALATILCKYLKLTEDAPKATTHENEFDIGDDNINNRNENQVDIPMLNENFRIPRNSKKQRTLKEVLYPLGKHRTDFVKDVRKLYHVIRREEYESAGKKLPVGELLSLDDEKSFGEYLFMFASCLEEPNRKKFHIFNMSALNSLKKTIFNAYLEARDKSDLSTNDEVPLALRWGVADVDNEQCITSSMFRNNEAKIIQYRSMLLDALSKNLVVFVGNFVKLDIDINDLFTPPKFSRKDENEHWSAERFYLKELYSPTKRKNADPLYMLDAVNEQMDFKREKDLVDVFQILIGDFMHSLYGDEPEQSDETDPRLNDAEKIYRDIFLWCVLTYRLDMAKIFLSLMKTRICSALIASKILKSLAEYAPDQVAKDTLCQKADDFENYAIGFVRCSYFYDKNQACELILRRLELYGGVTCLQMAVAADDKKFLYEDACQALLTNIWYDKVDPIRERKREASKMDTHSFLNAILSYYQNEGEQALKERRLHKSGIDYTDDYDIQESVWRHFIHFHTRPIVKFWYTLFGYILFLLFFGYYMLFAFDPPNSSTPDIHWTEIMTIITVTTMLVEEIREIIFQDSPSLMGKIRCYFDLNNRASSLCLVVPSYILFYVGLILRFTSQDQDSFVSARIVMAYDLEIWFIRSVLFIGIFQKIGPKLVMIRKMTYDLLLFILIIAIFIFGYGVTSRSMTAYRAFDFNGRQFFRNVVYPVYYFVLGSFDDERSKLDETPDSSTSIATQFMLAFHMLFVNILLLNLLIALFSFTINEVETHARYVWAYNRCEFVRNYHVRPPLFPPLTFLFTFTQFCLWCWQKSPCACSCLKSSYWIRSLGFKMIAIDKHIDKAWSEFEQYSTIDYIRKLLDEQANMNAGSMMTGILSNASSTDNDDVNRITALMLHWKEEVENIETKNDARFTLMMEEMETMKQMLNQNNNSMPRAEMKSIGYDGAHSEAGGDSHSHQNLAIESLQRQGSQLKLHSSLSTTASNASLETSSEPNNNV